MKNLLAVKILTLSKTLVISLAIISAGCGIVSLSGSKPEVLPFAAPPAGSFPAQIGNIKISGEPRQEAYSTATNKTYSTEYRSQRNSSIKYRLNVFTAPVENRFDVPQGWELVSTTSAAKVYFAAGLEELFIIVYGDTMTATFESSSIADTNELLENIPFQTYNVTPSPFPMVVILPPLPIVKKNPASPEPNKIPAEVMQSSRELAIGIIKTTLKSKLQIDSNPRVNKLDPSTLMIETDKDLENSMKSKVEDGIKTSIGSELKKLGFRQFVLYPDIIKLD